MPDPTPKHPPVKLTKGYIDKVTPGPKDEFHWDAYTKGFGLRVNPTGRMTFVAQGRVEGRAGAPARITIGPFGVFTVDQAREVAKEHLLAMLKGVDPRDVKREDEAKAITLRQVADAFFARPDMLKENTRDEMERHLETAFTKWLTRPIASITPEECSKRYEEIATKGLRKMPAPAPGSAASAFKILKRLINWAKDRYTTKDDTPIIKNNPVDAVSEQLAKQAGKVRTRHIDRRQIGAFWNLLTTARQNPAFSADTHAGLDLVMFLLLTGTRRNEGAALTWDRVNLDDTDPAECWFHLPDPKNSNPVWLPLSSQAVAVLKARKAADDRAPVKSKFCFPSRSAAGHIKDTRAPLERFSKAIGMDRLSAHDLRRTFVTIGANACRLDVAKLGLLTNHKPQGVTQRHYLETSDLRDYHREVQTIGDYIENEGRVTAAKASGANVVTLARPA
jgi:integrase